MPEQMKPVENPVLVDAMATFKLDLKNKEHEMAFLKAAVEARYLLPAQVEQQPDSEQTEDGKTKARIAFQIMTNQNGEQFMPVYTDEVEMRKARKPQPGERFQVAVMSFMDIYRFVKANEPIRGVVINPAGSALCLIRPQVIAIGDNGGDLNAKMTQEATVQQNAAARSETSRAEQQASQQAAIRQAMADMEAAKAASENESAPDAADVISDDLLDALKACLKKQKAVKKAYIQPETEKGEQYLLIALEADENADLDNISAAVAKDCADYSDLPFDCVAASSIRAKELIANEKPFYEKKRFGIF